MASDYISVKDQLGRPDSVKLFVKKVTDALKSYDSPLIISKRIISSDTMWDNISWDSGYWDDLYTNTPVLIRVINRNNIHVERFVTTDLKDTGTTTGDWNTADQLLFLSASEVGQNLAFFKDVTDITNATMTVIGNIDNATLYMSSDGTNFEEVTNNTKHGFTNVGQTGKWKIVATADVVTADLVMVEYNT